MLIGADLRPLGQGVQTGIARVAGCVFKELVAADTEQYLPMGLPPGHPLSERGQAGSRGDREKRRPWAKGGDIDLLLSFFNPVPVRRNIPGVLFIHDLIPVRFPALCGNRKLTPFFERLRDSARSCQRLVTNSLASKRDIVELWGIDGGKIAVAPLAADDFLRLQAGVSGEDGEDDRVFQRHGIIAPYVLSVGSIEPRKNLSRLLSAFEQIREGHNEYLQIVFAGSLGWQSGEFVRQIEESKYRGDIVMTGYVSDRELAALYRGAAVFAYPSLYEGFGLPILEAMGCGIPVIASSSSSMPEVGGDCACYCDPLKVESIAAALETVLFDEERRRMMAAAGIEWAGRFSWAETAAIIRGVIGEVFAERA